MWILQVAPDKYEYGLHCNNVTGPMLEARLESKLEILPIFQLSVNFAALRSQVSVTNLANHGRCQMHS